MKKNELYLVRFGKEGLELQIMFPNKLVSFLVLNVNTRSSSVGLVLKSAGRETRYRSIAILSINLINTKNFHTSSK